MIYIDNESDLKLVGTTAVKFYTDWCAPCKKMDTILNKMEKEFPDVKLYSIDIDKMPKIAQKYKIMSVPTVIFFEGEHEVENRVIGLVLTEPLRKAFKAVTKTNS